LRVNKRLANVVKPQAAANLGFCACFVGLIYVSLRACGINPSYGAALNRVKRYLRKAIRQTANALKFA